MSWMLAVLAVLAAGVAGTSGGEATPGPVAMAQGAIVDNTQSGRINVQGRAITVEVQVFRNLMPPINWSGGDPQLQVRISTLDGRGLPNITSIKAQVTNTRRQTWKPVLFPFRTLVFDPNSMMWGASGGPRWPVGSHVTIRIEVRVANRTYPVSIPATIRGVH